MWNTIKKKITQEVIAFRAIQQMNRHRVLLYQIPLSSIVKTMFLGIPCYETVFRYNQFLL